VVVHGADDALVRVEGGRDTAAKIAGARLVEIACFGTICRGRPMIQIADAIESTVRAAT